MPCFIDGFEGQHACLYQGSRAGETHGFSCGKFLWARCGNSIQGCATGKNLVTEPKQIVKDAGAQEEEETS